VQDPVVGAADGQGGGQAFGPHGGGLGCGGVSGSGVGRVGTGAAGAEADAAVEVTGAAVVGVGASVVGGVSVVDGNSGAGAAASGAEAGRAVSVPGREAALPPDSMATDTARREPGSACDTATAVTTMATLDSATISTRGDSRRTQCRCTDLTSRLPAEDERAHKRVARPQPVRLSRAFPEVGGRFRSESTGQFRNLLIVGGEESDNAAGS